MSDLESQLRAVLADGWRGGEPGKGLVLVDGALRTWRSLPGGDPHHSPAMKLLGIPQENVAAYLGIEANGAVEVWAAVNGADELVDRALASDERLHRVELNFDFLSFDEEDPAG